MAAWLTLGTQWAETMAASAQVIARRTSRTNTPAQWLAMGSEKLEAAVESSNAMALRMLTLPVANPAAMWVAYARILTTGLHPYRQRALSNARSRHA
jgi:hypothetical protein